MSEARDERVVLRGLTFHYRDWGGHGQPLVLLHGLASTSHIWDLVAPLLADRFRVLAPDQRGHGESDKPEDGYDFDSVSADLDSFLSALGLEAPVLVGHSWGGNVAVHYAAHKPEVPKALVLVDGGFLELSSWPGMTWERVERELAPPDFSGFTVDRLLAEAPRWELGPIWGPAVERAVLANFFVDADGTIRPRLRREHHMRILRAIWEHRPSALYERVTCPVLLIAAAPPSPHARDSFMRAKRQGVAAAERLLSRCRVVWMEETVHDVPLHRPRELAQAIAEFVSGDLSLTR